MADFLTRPPCPSGGGRLSDLVQIPVLAVAILVALGAGFMYLGPRRAREAKTYKTRISTVFSVGLVAVAALLLFVSASTLIAHRSDPGCLTF
jgi:hypothetical protein